MNLYIQIHVYIALLFTQRNEQVKAAVIFLSFNHRNIDELISEIFCFGHKNVGPF